MHQLTYAMLRDHLRDRFTLARGTAFHAAGHATHRTMRALATATSPDIKFLLEHGNPQDR